eukprot:351059-Chlamydomonas_euryale.AAC.3
MAAFHRETPSAASATSSSLALGSTFCHELVASKARPCVACGMREVLRPCARCTRSVCTMSQLGWRLAIEQNTVSVQHVAFYNISKLQLNIAFINIF